MERDPIFLRAKQLAEEQGWAIEKTRGGHWKFIPPDPTKPPVITSGSGGGGRGLRNFASDMQQSGLDWQRPKAVKRKKKAVSEKPESEKTAVEIYQQEKLEEPPLVIEPPTSAPVLTDEERAEFDRLLEQERQDDETLAQWLAEEQKALLERAKVVTEKIRKRTSTKKAAPAKKPAKKMTARKQQIKNIEVRLFEEILKVMFGEPKKRKR